MSNCELIDTYKDCINSLQFHLTNLKNQGVNWVYSHESVLLNVKEIDDYQEEESNKVDEHSIEINSQLNQVSKPLITNNNNELRYIKSNIIEDDNNLTNYKKSKSISKIKIVFVKLCPNEEEVKSDLMFKGPSWEVIEKISASIGWKEENIYKTYLYKHPIDYLQDDVNDLEKLRNNFFEEISDYNPKIIICFGERVSNIISQSKKTIEELRKTSSRINCYDVFYLWDIDYFMKYKELKQVVWNDIKKANSLLHII